MTLDTATVDKLAHLARLHFNEEDKAAILSDLNRMLEFVEKISELDTDGVEPLIYMNDAPNQLRPDEAHTDMTRAEALKNAPHADSEYFRVPKVLDK
jgi:aspartyl-tRNA(Asn)/glutamyl-tRNA(Gln) amidotransferase subunit C